MESENRTFCTQSLAFKHSNNSSLSPLHAIRVLRDDFFVDITRDTPPDFLEAMRFNQKELFLYGLDCAGDADKEGVLSLREKDKLFRRPNYVQRWFRLKGNILFYLKTSDKDSIPYGAFILERCKVRIDPSNERKHAFLLLFEDGSAVEQHSFCCSSDKDRDEWTSTLKRSSYEELRSSMATLRQKLFTMTGKDPLTSEYPYCPDVSVNREKKLSSMNAVVDVVDGGQEVDNYTATILELSLSCSGLSLPASAALSTYAEVSILTPPESTWLKHTETDVVKDSITPHYSPNITFYTGMISMITRLQVRIFCLSSWNLKPILLGSAHFNINEIITAALQSVTRELRLDSDTVKGYVTVQAWKTVSPPSRRRFSSPIPETLPVVEDKGMKRSKTEKIGGVVTNDKGTKALFRGLFSNSISRHYVFQTKKGPAQLKVCEVMGESLYNWTVPKQLINLFVREEQERIDDLKELSHLNSEWDSIRNEIQQEHVDVVTYYKDLSVDLDQYKESTFKQSKAKASQTLQLVATNLHVQRLQVVDDTDQDKTCIYDIVTIGAPAAHSLKFKQGGLKRIFNSSRDGKGWSLIESDSRTREVKHFLEASARLKARIDDAIKTLISAASQCSVPTMNDAMSVLREKIDELKTLCETPLVSSAVETAIGIIDGRTIGGRDTEPNEWVWDGQNFIRAAMDCNLNVHELCMSVESKVDALSQLRHGITDSWHDHLSEHTQRIAAEVQLIVKHVKTCLQLLLLQEEKAWKQAGYSCGLHGPTHRRDVILSQAVSGIVTCFMLHIRGRLFDVHFLQQLSQIGFLAHWESLLSTHGDEMGMLEDFCVAIEELNKTVTFSFSQCDDAQAMPFINGCRSSLQIAVPLPPDRFRLLPQDFQKGRLVRLCVVPFSQGVNEEQSLSDTFGDNSLHEFINSRSLNRLVTYFEQYRDLLSLHSPRVSREIPTIDKLLQRLRQSIDSKKNKNIEILSLSAEACRKMNGGRLTSCKSAKDRTSMSVTLTQAQILLKEHNLHPDLFEQVIDQMRSDGTRLLNAEKNVGEKKYAFNGLQVRVLPKSFRPPEGTYRTLQT
ncbi:inositol polyphosphate-4-phosphatase type I A-like isoform X2 [Oscarella lobularis]|uniref:inositol polyphosphate-4-phosphatase type I A-like isoform X2 n=1 Tax=Oscarella lobularis TaxID=121494 RepID=UPI00331445AA